MIQQAIRQLIAGKDLEPELAGRVMDQIARGAASNAQIACILTGLRMKGESSQEIAAFSKVMQGYAVPISPRVSGLMVDTCGTGGDGPASGGTFNISTAAAIVAAASGATVVKHGNRSVSSRCGSADVLEALGVTLGQTPQKAQQMIEEIGIGFLYAPNYHPAMRYVSSVRKELGFHTVFNILGPLLNPAFAQARLVGVYRPDLVPLIAETLNELGVMRAMVVYGDGFDEITNTGETLVAELDCGKITFSTLTPDILGVPCSQKNELMGGSPDENAEIIREIFRGNPGPRSDIVALNAGAAIYISGRAHTLHEGIKIAYDSIYSKKAAEKLADLIRISGRAS